MKVGIQSPYLDTLGGGERYILTVAEFFIEQGHEVHILWDKGGDLNKMAERFGLNLASARFAPNIFSPKVGLLQKLKQSRSYDLMVVLSDGSIPLSAAKKNWIHLQVPFQKSNRPKIFNSFKLLFYQKVLCNSLFTKGIIDTTYGTKSDVLYPPVDVDSFTCGKKEKMILTVGRFFAPAHLGDYSPKKQKEMITIFKEMVDGGLRDWKLVLLGSAAPDQQDRLEALKDLAKDYPIAILTDVPYRTLQDFYSKATMYWHAAGFGEDLKSHPERAEHFGITTVEAMASGCVPIIFAGGGQTEIVTDKETGFYWKTEEELITLTKKVISDKKVQEEVAKKAYLRSRDFSKEKFYATLSKLV